MRTVSFIAGFIIVGATVFSAIRTVILPRAAQSWLTRLVFVGTRIPIMALAGPKRSYEWRDRVLALYAPISLFTLPLVWLTVVAIGYTLMFYTLDPDLGRAFHLSISSITTLGFADADTVIERVFAFMEAGLGLTLLALMITFLPAIYNAFARREVQVGQLEVRAGSPCSAVTFLLRHQFIGSLDDGGAQLDATFERWERWFAQIEESHLTYPALVFFRSPQADRSWVTAAGTMLDSAALATACVRHRVVGSAGLCIRAGFIALRRIADFYGIRFDHDPSPDDPISIARDEFDVVWDRLAAAGVQLVDDRDQAWRDFAGWRVNYDEVLLALAEITVAPYAPWTADRSAPSRHRPRIRRFGTPRGQQIHPESIEVAHP